MNKCVRILGCVALMVAMNMHAYANLTNTNYFDMNVPFVSQPLSTATTWKQIRDSQVIKQNLDYSCGASSLATIMNYFYKIDMTERQLLEEMEEIKQSVRKREVADNEVTMASFYDLANVSKKHHLVAKGIATNYDSLKKLTIPVIVYLNHKRNDHFSVVRAIDDHHVYLADSSWGNRTLSRQQFEEMWHTRDDDELQGRVLLVLPTNEQQKQQTNKHFTAIRHTQTLLKQSPELFRPFIINQMK